MKQLARQSLGLSAAQNTKEQPSKNPPRDDDNSKSKHHRTGSLTGIIKQARKQLPSSGLSEEHHDTRSSDLPPVPKPPKQVSNSWWISKKLHDPLMEQENFKGEDINTTTDDEHDLKKQQSLNNELKKYFPMLGDSESVIGCRYRCYIATFHNSKVYLCSVFFFPVEDASVSWSIIFYR